MGNLDTLMADLSSILAVLEHDPDDAQALDAVPAAARAVAADVRTQRFGNARKVIAGRGRPDTVIRLLDAELAATTDVERKVDLLLEKGMTLDGDLLDVPGARASFREVLALRPDDTMAKEAIDELDLAAGNWQKFAEKYVKEAQGSTDRSLATGLYMSAAEAFVRFSPDAPEAERYLEKALEVDAKNAKAAFHLARLYRRAKRWADVQKLLEQRAEIGTGDEKIAALIALAELARGELAQATKADEAIRRVLALDPGQPQALRAVGDSLAGAGNWKELVAVFSAALRARKEDDLGLLLQVAMISWRHLKDLDQAEEYFRRVRKLEPAHPAALDFYREYYPAKGEQGKLLALLRSVEKDTKEPVVEAQSAGARRRPISMEIAVLSESQNNPEKSIEAWKQHLRQDPTSSEARTALQRLYRKTEKWNALLDLMKDEIEKLPETDVEGRVTRLLDVVEIYRDKLRLDVMVINTYNAILKIDPDNRRATDELAAKFRALGRWNDLIAVLTRKSEAPDVPDDERVVMLREVADLWADRFGNFANAIKPLEKILELDPSDVDAVARLKDIYTRRRQWRALIDVLGREASALAPVERRAKQMEMSRLSAERLGDTRLSIEILNVILGEATTPAEATEALAGLAGLYEREKRHLAHAEILHRQVAAVTGKDRLGLLEKLGQVYADRLAAPQNAAEQWQEILEIEPNHARALRTLRELYAAAGDFAGLERLYAKLGQEDELVEALLAIADRIDAKDKRLPLVERAAQLAQERADKATAGTAKKTDSGKTDAQALERARQVWERVLAVEPNHVAAATALAPIYTKQEKWSRLISVLEIELVGAKTTEAKLAKLAEIRQVSEHKLGSRTVAFTWTIKAFDLDPESEPLFDHVLRLASEPEQWREVVAAFERGLAAERTPAVKLALNKELAKIAARRLGDPERARGYHRAVLALVPDDRAAEQSLEELAIQLADWPELLASYRRRAAREKDATERASLLIEIASLQEEKLVDLDGAAATYHEALGVGRGAEGREIPQVRALRALARIEEARGDWESLVGVLAQELAQTTEPTARFGLLMRLGELEEKSLERPAPALAHYREALAIPAANGSVRPQAVVALTRIGLDPASKIASDERVATARLVLPHHESGKQHAEHATAMETIRKADTTPASEKLELDRALMRLYHVELGDPAAAWQAGLRVVAADPTDTEVRGSLGVLAGQLGRDGEWAKELGQALATVRPNGAPGEIRAIATELAQVAGARLGDKSAAEKAWLTVLEVEPDAPDAFDALTTLYRADQRWSDLRALLERRADVTVDDRVRLASLLELAALEEDVLGQPALAAAAHRRVLELDPTYLPSYQSLDRLYASGTQWKELEELLARQTDHAKTPREIVELHYRRAELFAHRLVEPARAVDLVEDILARQRSHADARELLEEQLPTDLAKIEKTELVMRVARLLEPLYEADKLWKDLVHVLRVQRAMVSGTEAVELLSRIATIEEAELSGARNAFEAWTGVLALDPTHERARVEIVRLAEWLQRWPEATAALEAAVNAAPSGDLATRAALLTELANYYDVQAGDVPRAIATYKKLLETDPATPASVRRAGNSLARLYEETEAWGDLRDVTRKQSEWAEDPAERRALLAQVAGLEEQQLDDRRAAINTWRDVLADSPGDTAALAALERLYLLGERWRDLVEILRKKLEQLIATSAPADLTKPLLARIAEIHEGKLTEPDEAIAAYLELIDIEESETPGIDVYDAHALVELARLYRASQRYADLLDILERQAAPLAPDSPSRHQLGVEIANLLAGPLGRNIDALERWAEILRHEPEHDVALAAVEKSLADLDLRDSAAQILEPIYEGTGRHDRLAELLGKMADWSDDPGAKLRALGRVVRLRETALGDKAGAFTAQLAALRHAAAEPELAQVVAESERLAGELGKENELIDAYREVAPNVLDAEIQRRLYLDVADLARAVRRDHELARTYYQKVLESQPDDRRALIALESIYRDTHDDERLTEVLLRQADITGSDVDDRVHALVEAAGLYNTAKRFDDSIATWEQVLAVAPERRDAVAALEALYREQGRWPDVVDLYERRLGFATSVEEAVALQVQLGEIHEVHLRDLETAIDNYSAALSGNSAHPVALAAVERYLLDPDIRMVAAEVLEPIYVAQHRWQDLIRVYESKLDGTSDVRERLRLTRFVARLHEEQLEDFESASRWYARLFREAPSDATIRDQLQRLAAVVDNWAFVAQAYQGYLDDEAGESPDLREVAIAAATIYDRRLGLVDQAYVAYRRALAIDTDGAIPDERELLKRVEDMLDRANRPAELVAIYDDTIQRAGDELRRDAQVKRARLVERGLGDTARAIDAWRDVVLTTEDGTDRGDEAAYREAVTELERLYRARATAGERNRWRELVESLEARLGRAQGKDPREVADLRLKLAEIHEVQLEDLTAALDQYEQVIIEGVGWEAAVGALERLVVHEAHRERIAELLEPVYRKQDWWQRLVVILDAKLAYVRDPVDQIATLHEIAEIHELRDGALDLALEALARAWRIDVVEDDSLMRLLSLAGKLQAWDMVIKVIEEGAPSAPNSDMVAGLWTRAAQIHEQQRGDNVSAIHAWRQVDEARPDDLVALAALDRLLALERRPEELVKVIARRAELTEDAGVRLVLFHRVATLHEEVLHDKPAAIATYKSVLGVDDSDLEALDALERLYRETGDGRELVATIERKIELTADLPARQALRHAAAQVYETQLDDVYQAINHYTAVLDDDASDAAALASLDRIYVKQRMWPELLDVVDRRALLAISATERADLAHRAAVLVETELSDPDAAIPRYGAVLQVHAPHAAARTNLEALMARDEHVESVTPLLERVYRADSDVPGLVRVLERRLAKPSDDLGARHADWEALAEVHETIAGKPAAAFAVWARAIEESPDEVELLKPLDRLAQSQGMWADLAALLDRLLDKKPGAAEVEQAYAARLGQIAEDKLANLDRAATAFERASHGPEPRTGLAALERVLARSGRWGDLAGVLRRQADASERDDQTAEYLFRLGDLQETTLHQTRDAIAAYREVLSLQSNHAQARAALERILASGAGRDDVVEIVEVLEPLFEQDNDAARLVMVLEARLGITPDPLDQAGLLARLVEIAEDRLGDQARALDAALRWLAVEPSSHQALATIDRFAERLDRWPDVAARIDAIVHVPEARTRDAEVQVGLLVFLGGIQRERLDDLDAAASSYRGALGLEPDSLTALDPLIDILRTRGADARADLADALRQRAKVVTEPAEKRAAHAEVAQLAEALGDRAAAIAAWRDIIDDDGDDRAALDQLARIYRFGGKADRGELIEILGRSARLAASATEEKSLRVEVARLEDDGPRAVAAWQAVLDLDPDDPAALGSLEGAYGRASDWAAVADVQGRRLALARTTAERIAIHGEIAQLAEGKRNSVDDALASWFAVLDLDNAHVPAYRELERLLTAASRWHDLVDLLEREAELAAARGDAAQELSLLARCADIWEGKLDNPDAAGEILEKILARDPSSVAALTRLSKIYERANDWDKCKATLERALKLNPTGRDAADLFYRLAEVARVGDGDPDTAIQHANQALRHDPNHGPAIAALEKLARDKGNQTLLADMLRRKVETVAIPTERVAIYVELAELERRAGHDDVALAALARASEAAPNDVRVLGPLADLYFNAGRLDEAAPIYGRLAEEAKAGRRMKDVARYRQREGGILEKRGDKPGALVAYEDSLRLNPTDVSTMSGLGRLYFDTQDWEKARRIYQSLVLQNNIEVDAGVTKAEVYFALGTIHLQLGQPPKAKSMFQRGLEIEPQNQRLKEALASVL